MKSVWYWYPKSFFMIRGSKISKNLGFPQFLAGLDTNSTHYGTFSDQMVKIGDKMMIFFVKFGQQMAKKRRFLAKNSIFCSFFAFLGQILSIFIVS